MLGANMDNSPNDVNGLLSCTTQQGNCFTLAAMTTFRKALIQHIEASGKSLRSVAKSAGVSYDQLSKVMQRENASTNVDSAQRVAQYFGKTLDEFLGMKGQSGQHEVSSLYTELSEEARQQLLSYGKWLRESEHSASRED